MPTRRHFALALLSVPFVARAVVDEPIVGLPCEGCDAVFAGRPDAPAHAARIAPVGEPGEAMRIDGGARDAAGRPVAGIVVYAYHTDRTGTYPRDDAVPRVARAHGRLRGWATTDAQGRYRFDTIRPAGYPGRTDPAHVHLHVIEPGRCTYYLGDLVFDDDPRLDAAQRPRFGEAARGGSGIAVPTRDPDGTWRVTRDIVLGANVPGYGACGAP